MDLHPPAASEILASKEGRHDSNVRKNQPTHILGSEKASQWLRWRILAFSIGLSTLGTTGTGCWWLLSKVYVDIWTGLTWSSIS